jgi:hypothetical protein
VGLRAVDEDPKVVAIQYVARAGDRYSARPFYRRSLSGRISDLDGQPRATVDRVLHELHLLGLLVIADDPSSVEDRRVGWRYSLTVDAERVRANTLRRLAGVTRFRRTCPKGLRPDQDQSRATYVCSAGGAESGDVLLDHLAGVKAAGQGTDRWNVPVQSQYSRDPG